MDPHHPRTRQLMLESLLVPLVLLPILILFAVTAPNAENVNTVGRIGAYLLYGAVYFRWLPHAAACNADSWTTTWNWKLLLTVYPAYAVYLLTLTRLDKEDTT